MSAVGVGDPVSFVFGQPGNDTTFGVVTAIRGDAADFWDACFWMQITDVPATKLHDASPWLDRAVGSIKGNSLTLRELIALRALE